MEGEGDSAALYLLFAYLEEMWSIVIPANSPASSTLVVVLSKESRVCVHPHIHTDTCAPALLILAQENLSEEHTEKSGEI